MPSEKRHRLYIDESGDHTFQLADNDNQRYLGLLGLWFDTDAPYRAFAQAVLTSREIKLKKKEHAIPGLELADLLVYPFKREMIAERRGEDLPEDFSATLLDAARPKMNCLLSTRRIAGYGKVWLD